MTRPRAAPHAEPSLVPLADMLCNTVGIMLFILIFTVLATEGATRTRGVPREHASEKRPLILICAHGKLYPAFLSELILQAYREADPTELVRRAQDIETEYFTIRLQYEDAGFNVTFTPRADRGEAASEIAGGSTALAELLSRVDADKTFISYQVSPDSIEAFLAAREYSVKRGFEYGWQANASDGRYHGRVGACENCRPPPGPQ